MVQYLPKISLGLCFQRWKLSYRTALYSIFCMYVLFLLILLLGFDKAFISFPITINISGCCWTLVNETNSYLQTFLFSSYLYLHIVKWMCSSFSSTSSLLSVMFSYFFFSFLKFFKTSNFPLSKHYGFVAILNTAL